MLIADADLAADVTQDAWLAMLQHPPASKGSLRPWLATVIRNFAFRLRRSEFRRRQRERAVAPPEKVLSASEVVARAETRQKLVDHVLGLAEPYRSTILFRFYEDRSPREIANNQNVPIETVYTRLKRGLALLRTRLDKDFGDRRTWCLALAPLVGAKVMVAGKAAAAGTAASGTVLSGGAIMATKAKIVIAAVLFVGMAAVLLHVALDFFDVEAEGTGSEIGAAVVSLAESASLGPADPGTIALPESELVREQLASATLFIAGQVIDKVTRQPVTAFHLNTKLKGRDEKGERIAINETILDPEGRFQLPVDECGRFLLMFHSSRHITTSWYKVEVPPQGSVSDLRVELDPGRCVSGRVVEDATGRPLAGALVSLPGGSVDNTVLLWLQSGFSEYYPHAITGGDGCFELCGLREWDRHVNAVHREFAQGSHQVSEHDVEIRLKKGFSIFGRAFDDNGDPAAGILIRLSGEGHRLPTPVLTGPDGRFRTAQTLPGTKNLYAGNPPGRDHYNPGPWPKHPAFAAEWKAVQVVDRDVEVNFGVPEEWGADGATYELEAGMGSAAFIFEDLGIVEKEFEIHPGQTTEVIVGRQEIDADGMSLSITGHVRRNDGVPLEGFEMGFHPSYVPAWKGERRWLRVVTDPQGRYVFRDASPGEWAVSGKSADGDLFSFERLWIALHQQDDVELNIILGTGMVTEELYDAFTDSPLSEKQAGWWVSLIATEAGSSKIRISRKQGPCRFRIENVAAGTYRLVVSARGYAKRLTGAFTLEAGGAVDVGRIALQPDGQFYLEVMDRSNRPVLGYRILGKAPACRFDCATYISDGKYRYESLPIGPLTFVVTAGGFEDQEVTVNIVPGEAKGVRVVLETD